MNCSKTSVMDILHLFCCLLRQCPESTPMACPIIKSSCWCLEEKWNLGVNYQDSGLWWVLQQIISLPYPVICHWWVSILDRICYMKTWISTLKSFTQLKLITSPDKYFLFLWNNLHEFFGTNDCIPKRWPMAHLQLSLPPCLKPLVTPLAVRLIFWMQDLI